MTIAFVAFAALIGLSLTGVPLAFAALFIGIVGFSWFRDWSSSFAMAGQQFAELLISPNLIVIPLFVLMGEFIRRSGIADELYQFGNAIFGRVRGGLAMSTVMASGAFSAVCGSSVASAATMAKVAVPPMRRFGYHDRLSAGTVAAGGTLGILIPPSVPMVIYCIFAREDIGRMFIAGVVPGLLLMSLFLLTILIWLTINPRLGGELASMTWRERMHALRRTWAFVVLFLVVIGGLYLGVFTPTEAASVGAVGAYLFALFRGSLPTLKDHFRVTGTALGISATIFAITGGAMVFAQLINITGLPYALQGFVTSWGVSGTALVLAICVLCIVLGMVFDPISILVLIIPIFLPSLESQGIDMIWFGILVIILIELGLITPPVGVNVFTVKAAQPDLHLGDVFRGTLPFTLAMIVTGGIVFLFPEVALWLPNLMR